MKPSKDFIGDNPKEGTINPIIGLANALNKKQIIINNPK